MIAEFVAPYAGAWIETPVVAPSFPGAEVAPYAGAWIETSGDSPTR